jgi:hypothetical protein
VPNPSDPQAFNRYSYVLNNPLRYIDPSGHASVCGFSYSDPECYGPDPWAPPSSGGGGGIYIPLDSGKKQNKPKVVDEPQPVVIVAPPVAVDVPGQCDWAQCTDERETLDNIDPPLRQPDYTAANFATGWPFGVVGLDIQITVDSYFNWYVSGGIYVGTPGFTLFDGWIFQEEPPSQEDIEGFITSNSIFVSGGYWVGGGATWGRPFDGELNWNDIAVDAGFSTPGGAGGWTYGVFLYDNPNGK